MKTLKIGVMLLALLLAAMVMVPMASAADSAAQGDNSDQKIVSLYQPIHNEIQSNVSTAINERITTHDQYYKDLSSSLVKKYQTNLDSIIDILETKTGQQLSAKQRDTVKQIIVAEDLNKVVQENRKKELGVNATQMRTLQVQPDNVQMKSSNLQLTALPDHSPSSKWLWM